VSSNKKATIPVYIILVLFAITTIAPFYFMITISLKPDSQITQFSLFPKPLVLDNYPWIFARSNMIQGFMNSIKVTVLTVGGQLFTDSIAAYAFSKIRFRGSKFLFSMLMTSMMIPGVVLLVPQYILIVKFGLQDSHWALILPSIIINAYGIFLIKSFMDSLPDSYIESAKIDGAGQFRIYAQIVVPLSRSALVAFALISFIGNWGSLLQPLIYLNSEAKFTLPLIINTFRDTYSTQYGHLTAASTVTVIPIVIIYFFSQKYFIEGVTLTGLKT